MIYSQQMKRKSHLLPLLHISLTQVPLKKAINQCIYWRQISNYPFEIIFLHDECLKTLSKTLRLQTKPHARKISGVFGDIYRHMCKQGKPNIATKAAKNKRPPGCSIFFLKTSSKLISFSISGSYPVRS